MIVDEELREFGMGLYVLLGGVHQELKRIANASEAGNKLAAEALAETKKIVVDTGDFARVD